MIITNILKGIRKRWIQSSEKPRFDQVSWLATRLLKNQEDQQLKKRDFKYFTLHYIRPYEVLKTYKEIFVEEIYKFETTKSHPVILDCGANIGISTIYFKTIYPNVEFKKVRIKEGEKSFEVVDYPKDFLENPRTKRIVERFVLKGKKMRETRKAVTKKD